MRIPNFTVAARIGRQLPSKLFYSILIKVLIGSGVVRDQVTGDKTEMEYDFPLFAFHLIRYRITHHPSPFHRWVYAQFLWKYH